METGSNIFGTDWSEAEQDLIVATYFEIRQIEMAGGSVNKAEKNRELQTLTGRKRGSIEYKHMNVSEALKRIGLPYIDGYKPYSNIQDSLVDAVDRFLSNKPELLFADPPAALVGVAEPAALYLEPPPSLSDDGPPLRDRMKALVRKFDPAERDYRNRKLGRAGEEMIFEFEQRRLHDAGQKELSGKVRWVARDEGDGHGYDIESYNTSGAKRLIEVKTTTGDQTTPFFISRNEERVSQERDEFRLYRLYDFAKSPRLFKLRPPLRESVMLGTEVWRATFG